MKIRQGFVSNSSSSSFICQVCGDVESGMDMCLREAEMYECVNNHTFCETHTLQAAVTDDDIIIDEHSPGMTEESQVYERYCPLCNFKDTISNYDLISYLLKQTGKNRGDIIKELSGRFRSYSKFINEIVGGDI